VPTIDPSRQNQREAFMECLCDTLNGWAKRRWIVRGRAIASTKLGIGVVILHKTHPNEEVEAESELPDQDVRLLAELDRLRRGSSPQISTFQLIRGAKIFDADRLYVVKPIGQRFWTKSAALNDADQIAGTIVIHARRESA